MAKAEFRPCDSTSYTCNNCSSLGSQLQNRLFDNLIWSYFYWINPAMLQDWYCDICCIAQSLYWCLPYAWYAHRSRESCSWHSGWTDNGALLAGCSNGLTCISVICTSITLFAFQSSTLLLLISGSLIINHILKLFTVNNYKFVYFTYASSLFVSWTNFFKLMNVVD